MSLLWLMEICSTKKKNCVTNLFKCVRVNAGEKRAHSSFCLHSRFTTFRSNTRFSALFEKHCSFEFETRSTFSSQRLSIKIFNQVWDFLRLLVDDFKTPWDDQRFLSSMNVYSVVVPTKHMALLYLFIDMTVIESWLESRTKKYINCKHHIQCYIFF